MMITGWVMLLPAALGLAALLLPLAGELEVTEEHVSEVVAALLSPEPGCARWLLLSSESHCHPSWSWS